MAGLTKPRNTLTDIINDLDSGQDVNDLAGATIDRQGGAARSVDRGGMRFATGPAWRRHPSNRRPVAFSINNQRKKE